MKSNLNKLIFFEEYQLLNFTNNILRIKCQQIQIIKYLQNFINEYLKLKGGFAHDGQKRVSDKESMQPKVSIAHLHNTQLKSFKKMRNSCRQKA